jgi:hypothetical protein
MRWSRSSNSKPLARKLRLRLLERALQSEHVFVSPERALHVRDRKSDVIEAFQLH